jgi:putative ABC transport system ATP-binding protein
MQSDAVAIAGRQSSLSLRATDPTVGHGLSEGVDNHGMLFALRDVTYRRGDRVVLSALTVELPEGMTALVGPSGAGKSTLLRLLNRLADPDSGSIEYRGRDVRDYEVLSLRREIALVPQLPALLPGSVAENVRFGPGLCGRGCDLDRALVLAGLDSTFAERAAQQLSVGEQQRVMLARALALEPAVLLLDEPTAALDEQSRDAVERTLRDLHARLSAALIVVTHDRAQARRLGDRVLVLDGGRIQAQPQAVSV